MAIAVREQRESNRLADIEAIRTFWQSSEGQFYIPNYHAGIC